MRPLNQPKSASQVVIINRASSRFVSHLTQEIEDQPVPTVFRETLDEPPPFGAVQVEKPLAFEAIPPDFTESAPLIERYQRRR